MGPMMVANLVWDLLLAWPGLLWPGLASLIVSDFLLYLNGWPGGVSEALDGASPPKTGPAPAGFDAWLANGGGNYIAPQFQTHNIDGLPDGGWTGTADNYTTAVVGNASIAWIRKVAAAEPARPWFAYVAPKAAHEPFIPAPWHLDHWDASWPRTRPEPCLRRVDASSMRRLSVPGPRTSRAPRTGTARWRAGRTTTATSRASLC